MISGSVSWGKSPDSHLNMSNYDRFALPTNKDGRPQVIFVNVALQQVIDLVKIFITHKFDG